MSISVLEPRLLIGDLRRDIRGFVPVDGGAAVIYNSDDQDDSDDESDEEEEDDDLGDMGYPHRLPGKGY